MNKYESPKPRKFTSTQEAEHKAHEVKCDYVSGHVDEFLQLLACAYDWPIKEVLLAVAGHAHIHGRTLSEVLFDWFLGAYHPEAKDWDFQKMPINFEVYASVMRKGAAYA
ncbi:MAG: hypothetical protein AUG51_16965 [Acidobacteria bacterium 13_1_20CM_3_53_8]|nr:MAG: hypothetical protein AUG51_16965 [Acidobacteria bacterium 13_1_20CM_3_53_8]